MKIRHLYDLRDLRENLQRGDKSLVSRVVGVKKDVLSDYLFGRYDPILPKNKLAWRVLLAKVQSNKDFLQAVQDIDATAAPNLVDFEVAKQELFTCDKLAITKAHGTTNSYAVRDLIKEKKRKIFCKKSYRMAHIIILRAKYNVQFLNSANRWIQDNVQHVPA